ncbi:DUF1654 domain-containing protein [Pseudomonas fulva]|uniref:DUF1654 domain-containing protein n=1 Tax=Pseudomonas fulva TaxID=47880 RepID=UPI0034D64A93
MSAQENAVRMDELTSLERLGLRVSAMINSPLAQLDRRVLVHRMDTDADHDWQLIMELLGETDGVDMTFYDDGSVFLKWDAPTDDDRVIDRGEEVALVEPEDDDPLF